MNRWVVVAVVVAIGGAAWWVIGRGEPPRIPRPGPSGASPQPAAESGPSQAGAVAESRPETNPSEEPLRIVDDRTGAPVPFAEVFAFDRWKADATKWRSLARQGAGPIQIAIELGTRFEADDQGFVAGVRTGMDVPSLFIVAREGDRIGTRSTWLKELAIGRSALRVRVVDSEGKPVFGAPVAFHGFRVEGSPTLEALTAAPDGIADGGSSWLQIDPDAPLFVTFGWPLEPGEPVSLDRAALPRDPVPLVLRDWAAIKVVVKDPGGKAVSTGTAALWFSDYAEHERHKPLHGTHDALTGRYDWPHSVPIDAGEAVIRPVATGKKFEVFVSVEGWANEIVEVRSPDRSGETVVVNVTLRPPPAFTGRIVDVAGVPIEGAVCQIASGEDLEQTHWQGVDAEGRFRYVGPHWREDQESWLTFAVDRDPKGNGWSLHSHRMKVAREVDYGDHDLGDVRIDTNDVVVEGTVLGPDGTPFAGAKVFVGTSDSDRSWNGPFEAVPVTDALGRFRVTGGFEGAERIKLEAFKRDTELTATVLCARGSRGVVVRMQKLGQVEVRARVDSGLGDQDLLVNWASATAGTESKGTAEGRGDRTYLTEIEPGVLGASVALPAGAYVVSIGSGQIKEPFATVRDLIVRAGEPTRDPRLDLDLRGRVRVARVAPHSDGDALSDGRVWRETAAGLEAFPVATSGAPGVRVLIVDGRPVTVFCSGDHLRCVKLEGVTSDRDVRLPPGLDVKIDLDDLPPDVEVSAAPQDAEHTGWPELYGAYGGEVRSGSTSFIAEYTGPHRLRLWTREGSYWALPDPFVVDDVASQQIKLRFPRAQWERDRAAAASRPASGR